jgi:hypothetical protein
MSGTVEWRRQTAVSKVAVSYDDDLETYITGLTTPLNEGTLGKLNTFIVDLKSALSITNLSDTFDVMYILANETEEAALRNLVERDHDATNISSTSFTAFEGFTGDGTADYLDTDFATASDGVNYTENNASIGVYVRNNVSSDRIVMGARGAGSDLMMYLNYPSLGFATRVNTGTYRIDATNAGAVGMFIATRNGSGNGDQYNYINKTTPSQTASSAGDTDGLPMANIFILALSNGGLAVDFSTSQVAFAFVGEHITTAMRDDIVDCFEAYMDSNGKGVL